jgi:hypothetical protein
MANDADHSKRPRLRTIAEGVKRNDPPPGGEPRAQATVGPPQSDRSAWVSRVSREVPRPKCLDRGIGTDLPLDRDGGRDGRQKREARSDPGPEHWEFARSVVAHLPKTGMLFWTTVNPLPGVSPESVFHAMHMELDAGDCDHYTIQQRGKRGKVHAHSIVHARDPATFLRRFVALMRRRRFDPRATDVQAVVGWSNHVIGRGATRVTNDLARLAAYATRASTGRYVRPLPSQSRCRGVFARPAAQLERRLPRQPSTAMRACHECGGSLPEGATARRRFCRDACRLRCFRRRERRRIRWRLKLSGRVADVRSHES